MVVRIVVVVESYYIGTNAEENQCYEFPRQRFTLMLLVVPSPSLSHKNQFNCYFDVRLPSGLSKRKYTYNMYLCCTKYTVLASKITIL
jgi:hypothetical protein